MFNRMIAFMLLITLTVSNCSRYFICAAFKVNQKYITASFCENRNRPWIHCNGKCYLMKKIRQAVEKGKKESRENQQNNVQESIVESIYRFVFHTGLTAVISTPYLASRFNLPPPGIIQPPQ